MEIPNSLLERVFIYLSWDERARAARVCRRWLAIFHSPVLWRKIIFKPSSRRLTKFQYDLKAYRLARCLRAIGSHIRSYHVLKNDDLFLLNRILSIIAEFLEYASFVSARFDDRVTENTDEDSERNYGSFETRESQPLSDCEDKSKTDYGSYGDSLTSPHIIDISSYLNSGDPDAEATLRLVLRLQEREPYNLNYDSLDNEDEFFDDDVEVGRSLSFSYPTRPRVSWSHRPIEDLEHCAVGSIHKAQLPPLVLNFELEFHCEVDDLHGFAFGTGGALLSTIKRVVYQLRKLQRLRLTDLFLVPVDARHLVLIISHVTSETLVDLDLMHLHKPPIDIATALLRDPIHNFINPIENKHSDSRQTYSDPTNSNWYLLDSRWLTARPQRFTYNPLADLANLFPRLNRLTLAPTQLTGAMLLRLLYQTPLHELCLVQTDFTSFTISRDEQFVSHESLANTNYAYDDDDHIVDQSDHDLSDIIDWSEDIPHWRKFCTNPTSSAYWQPINSDMWQAALILKPNLKVYLKLKMIEYFTLIRWRSQSTPGNDGVLVGGRSVIQSLLSYWPQPSAPVESLTIVLTGEPSFLADLLNLRNPINVSLYSNFLTSMVIYLEHIPTSLISTSDFQNTEYNYAQSFDEVLRDIVTTCSSLKLLAIGGTLSFVHIMTILTICRQRVTSISPNPPFRLLLESQCCQFDGGTPDHIPVTISNWYSLMIDELPKSSGLVRIAECCISAALDQPHWHFLSNAEFHDQLYNFL